MKTKTLIKNLNQYMEFVKKLLSDAQKNYNPNLSDKLRISSADGKMYYYRFNPNTQSVSYINISNSNLIKTLAQNDYSENIIKKTKKCLVKLEKIVAFFGKNNVEDVYSSLHPVRKKIIDSFGLSDEQCIAKWKDKHFLKNSFDENTPFFVADDGQRVRSKSEILIANKLNKNNIPYIYEYPIKLTSGKILYPDFKILNANSGKEYYWEHFGKMDDPTYLEKTLLKIELYCQIGIYPGDNLIVSFETSTHPLNMNYVDNLIQKFLQ